MLDILITLGSSIKLVYKLLLLSRSQDFYCEGCGSLMKEALLPVTSGSASSQADKEAKELARQISFKVV